MNTMSPVMGDINACDKPAPAWIVSIGPFVRCDPYGMVALLEMGRVDGLDDMRGQYPTGILGVVSAATLVKGDAVAGKVEAARRSASSAGNALAMEGVPGGGLRELFGAGRVGASGDGCRG